jgi:hypothetical protein
MPIPLQARSAASTTRSKGGRVPIRARTAEALVLLACAATLWPKSAGATDYERNDVSSRALGLTTMLVPVAGGPLGMLAHGAARKHNRFLVIGTELLAGAAFDGRVVLMAGGMIGLESTDSGWTRIRGYAELGADFMYAQSRLSDTLVFRAEAGVRYQFRAYTRPHWQLQLGISAMSNFSHLGWAFPASLVWVFD